MSNLNDMLAVYRSDSRFDQIKKLLAQDAKNIQCQGLVGAFPCFMMNELSRDRTSPSIVIASDKEEAAYWFTTLSAIRQDKGVYYFPDSYKKPSAFDEVSKSNILHRTTTVSKIALNPHDKIIVSYPEAMIEQVVMPTSLNANRLDIQKGEKLDTDTAIEVLVEYGFEHVDFVYEPGQFSVRGGIVDIFSYGNDWPYRIELFDDDIESVRTFDPLSQLSIKPIARVSIVPNLQSQFTSDHKDSILKVFLEPSLLYIKDYSNFQDRIIKSFDKYQEFINSVDYHTLDEETKTFHSGHQVDEPSEWSAGLHNHHTIFVNTRSIPYPADASYDFEIKPQPNFNRNFGLLIENLSKNEQANIKNYLFTDNAKQINRFYSIFEDLEANVDFQPVEINLHEGFIDLYNGIACYTDHQIFERFHRYKINRGFSKEKSINLKMLRELQPGDFVSHIDHGVGRYSGLEKIDINGHVQESVRLIYKNNDLLYVSINSLHKISKYVGKDGRPPQLNKIGSDSWKVLKRKTKKKVKDIAKELIKLYAKRKASKGFAFPEDGYLQNELEASFIYEDTPDQITATQQTKDDMMKAYPMDRLICGDVGFGKTEIAIRAAFKAVVGGKQVAILVPTTILALQHNQTFKERLKEFGVRIDFINRFKSTKQKKETYQKLEAGELDILIGTHAILNKNIKFKDLGLLVIDEEQKFGVAAKEKLRNIKVNVDTLTLTATPIPRTLQFSLMAARDMSILRTPPPNRQPIYTERRMLDNELIKEALNYEVDRGGQVFFVHNRVKNLPDITAMIKRLNPDIRVAMAHGQMDSKRLEKTLIDFINGDYDVLVSTNIIETGLDISNANTIIINNAHQFGLSDLHQLRGRVGRSNKRAFCYLFCPPLSTLTPEAKKRIRTIEEFSDLGSGFEIAMRDMDIRGAGNLLGGEQSGFISEIGYETYQRILEDAIIELKENEYKELFSEEEKEDKIFVRDVQIDTDVEMLIPDHYVSVIQERLNLYTELDKIENEKELSAFAFALKDRFGQLPPQIYTLFDGLRLRWISKRLGFARIILKKNNLSCFFIDNAQSSYFESQTFKDILQYVGSKGVKEGLTFKQTDRNFILKKAGVKSLLEVKEILEGLITTTQVSV